MERLKGLEVPGFGTLRALATGTTFEFQPDQRIV
jgi:hypothetical protein